MGSVSGSLGTLLGGISRQPEKERVSGQVGDLLNMTSDVMTMLRRRNGTRLQGSAELGLADPTAVFAHAYTRGADDTLIWLVILPGQRRLVAFREGVELPVQASDAFLDYILVARPDQQLTASTVGDHTFIVNRTTEVQAWSEVPEVGNPVPYSGDPLPWPSTNSSRIQVLQSQYSREFEVVINVTKTDDSEVTGTGTHTTPASDDTDAESLVAPSEVIKAIDTALDTSGIYAGLFTRELKGSELILIPDPAAVKSYSITVRDGTGGQAMRATQNHEVSRIQDLPAKEQPGVVYKVSGGDSSADDLYMRFETAPDADGYAEDGTWVEARWGECILDENTMPGMVAFRGTEFVAGMAGEEVGGYTFPSWAERLVGDAESNPVPAFVSQRIKDVLSFQGRLCLIYDEGVWLSVVNDFFNLFKKTVTQLLPDGPIGIVPDSVQIPELMYGQLHNRNLVVFASTAQFVLPSSTVLTPGTAALSETTRFPMLGTVRPAAAGESVFFPVRSDVAYGETHTQIREFYTDSNLNTNSARPVTLQCRDLIKGEVTKLVSDPGTDKLFALTDDRSKVYVYEYLWEDRERVQSAWGVWEFREGIEVVAMYVHDGTLKVILGVQGEATVFFCDLAIDSTGEFTFNPALDMWVTGNATDGLAVFGIGIPDSLAEHLVCLDRETGRELQIEEQTSPGNVQLRRDFSGEVLLGVSYLSLVKPTAPFVKDDKGNPISTATLKLGRYFIHHNESGPFDCTVKRKVADAWTSRFSGRIVGDTDLTQAPVSTGVHAVPIRERNDRVEVTISTDSPYPMNIQEIEWDGRYYARARRV